MKLAALTMTRAEGDVIEEFLRHTAGFVDEIYVYNNVSLDATVEVVRKLQDEGLPVVLADCDIITTEGEWDNNNGLIRDVLQRSSADYLALLDPDEFLVVRSRDVLEDALAALPSGTHALVRWVTYIPVDGDVDEPRTLARIRHRLAREVRNEEKAILSRALLEQPGAVVAVGSHRVVGAENAVLEGIRLAHFPVRSVRQIQAKALLGWSTFVAMGMDVSSMGFQWRRLHGQLMRGSSWAALDLFHQGLSYTASGSSEVEGPPHLVFEPLRPVPRRYVHEELDLLEVALALTQQLAQSTALLARRSRLFAAGEVARRETALRDRFALLEREIAVLAAERNAFEERLRGETGEAPPP